MKISMFATVVFLSIGLPARAYEPAGTPEDWDPPMGAPKPYWLLLGDRLESGFDDDVDTYIWDVQGWYGSGRERAVLKSEGEGEHGESPEDAELQLLYSRLFAPFWEWQIGVRQDFGSIRDRSHVVMGIQGVVPYEFEWDSALFVSSEGDVSARIEIEYDLNVTQRWVLQPRVELNAAFTDDVTAGVDSSELGLRLRYHFRREFAPYIGISWERLHGSSKRFAERQGDPDSLTSLIIGIRAWF